MHWGWVLVIVILVTSILVNIYFTWFAVDKLHVWTSLKRAINGALGSDGKLFSIAASTKPAPLPGLPEIMPPSDEFSTEVALFGGSLLYHFEWEEFNELNRSSLSLDEKPVPSSGHDHLELVKYAQFDTNSNFAAVLSSRDANDTLTYWIVFRGTQTQAEMQADLEFHQRDEVHSGFLRIFERIWTQLSDIVQMAQSSGAHIIVIGHSLGAAVATLFLRRLQQLEIPLVSGYGFGSPRVGSPRFAAAFRVPWFNIMNLDDIFTTLPLAVMPNPQDPTKPYLFEHVGAPITFGLNWGSWLANHLMPIYLHFLKT